jgi:hypothetical protein
MASYEKSPEE